MSIGEFSLMMRVHVKRDRCGDAIIAGRLGHLYDHGSGRFGLVLEAPSGNQRLDRRLRSRRQRATACGFEPHQIGDVESILLFDPTDIKQARLAVKLVGAKHIRRAAQPTVAQLRARALFSERARPGRAHLALETVRVAGVGT